MVNVMGQTPEDAMRILQERIDEAQRQAQGARDFVEALQKARITGHDSRSEIEVEVNSDGRMVNIEIDEQALEGSASDLEQAIMEAYADAGNNMREFVRQRATECYGDKVGLMRGYLDTLDATLGSLGRCSTWPVPTSQ